MRKTGTDRPKNNPKRKILLFFFFFPAFFSGQNTDGQIRQENRGEIYRDSIYKDHIASVLLHKKQWELSYPILELHSGQHLELSFDDLSGETKDYSYTLIHCDARWHESDIPRDDYMGGFDHYQLNDYQFSFNTHSKYVHYKLILPNEEINPKISGNYILLVFEDYDREDVAFTKRFAVADPKVSIEGKVKRPVLSLYRNTGQQVDFAVNHGSYEINDPYSEVYVIICQNNNWQNSIGGLKPVFIKDGRLEYDYQQETVFPGGSEYRYFDIKSLRYQSEYIRKIEYKPPFFHVWLFPDQIRSNAVYFFHDDLNGKYYVDIQEEANPHTDADYVHVHFSLPFDAPLPNADIYVEGELTNRRLGARNRMHYSLENKAYELTLFLKQGYYNYRYIYMDRRTRYPDVSYIEGSHYETENDYVIYVYHRDILSRYDRLIGYQILNSLRRE